MGWFRGRRNVGGRPGGPAAAQPQALSDDEAVGITGGSGDDGAQAQSGPCGVQNCVCTTAGACCSCQGHTHVPTYR